MPPLIVLPTLLTHFCQITDFLFSPMVLMMGLPLILMLILPKVMNDTDAKKDLENINLVERLFSKFVS